MFTFQAASLLCSRLFNMMSSTISGTLTARGFCLSRNSAVCLNNINHRRSIRARTNFWLSSITGDWGRSFIGRPPFMFIICEWESIQGKKLENNSCLDWFWLSSWVQPAGWKPKCPQVFSDSQHTGVTRETTYTRAQCNRRHKRDDRRTTVFARNESYLATIKKNKPKKTRERKKSETREDGEM